MTWFAIYDDATGRLESVGTVVAPPGELAKRGLVSKALASDPQVGTKRWNEGTRDFDDVAPSPPEPSDGDEIKASLARIEAKLAGGAR